MAKKAKTRKGDLVSMNPEHHSRRDSEVWKGPRGGALNRELERWSCCELGRAAQKKRPTHLPAGHVKTTMGVK